MTRTPTSVPAVSGSSTKGHRWVRTLAAVGGVIIALLGLWGGHKAYQWKKELKELRRPEVAELNKQLKAKDAEIARLKQVVDANKQCTTDLAAANTASEKCATDLAALKVTSDKCTTDLAAANTAIAAPPAAASKPAPPTQAVATVNVQRLAQQLAPLLPAASCPPPKGATCPQPVCPKAQIYLTLPPEMAKLFGGQTTIDVTPKRASK